MKRHLRLDITHSSLFPEVAELLRRVPLDVLHHQNYPFRHPAAIYQLSLRQIARDIIRVLKYSAALRSDVSEGDIPEELAQSQRILIYSLREHLDDCQMILMCLVDPVTVDSTRRGPDEFLKAAALAERKLFWDAVSVYADSYLMPSVNALKHSQGRFRTVRISCSDSDVRLGFYLEEVDTNGTAQPAIKLHNGNSAHSYARDIRQNLGSVFKAAEGLRAAIDAILKRLDRSLLLTPEGAEIIPGVWTEMCKQVAALDCGIFPQEIKLPFIRFRLTDTGALNIREIERDNQLSFPNGTVRCSTITSADGMTKSYRMPYALGNRPKFR
jgi:hypothetical protein